MKKTLHKISKIISSIIFWILMVIIVILVVYIISIKYLSSQNRLDEVKINFYTIITQSMYPTIEAGDIVLDYKNDNDIYKVGDIITFVSDRSNGQITITHRVTKLTIENGKYYYTTKGDNNSTDDTRPVSSDNVIGKVVLTIPKVGYIQQFILSKFGWIAVIVIPCVGIIIYDLLKIVKVAYKKRKKPKLTDEQIQAKKELNNTISNLTTSKMESTISDISIQKQEELMQRAPVINNGTIIESKEEQIESLDTITDIKEGDSNETEIL